MQPSHLVLYMSTPQLIFQTPPHLKQFPPHLIFGQCEHWTASGGSIGGADPPPTELDFFCLNNLKVAKCWCKKLLENDNFLFPVVNFVEKKIAPPSAPGREFCLWRKIVPPVMSFVQEGKLPLLAVDFCSRGKIVRLLKKICSSPPY